MEEKFRISSWNIWGQLLHRAFYGTRRFFDGSALLHMPDSVSNRTARIEPRHRESPSLDKISLSLPTGLRERVFTGMSKAPHYTDREGGLCQTKICGIFGKCASVAITARPYCIADAAIQISFVGIGAPALHNALSITAYRSGVSSSIVTAETRGDARTDASALHFSAACDPAEIQPAILQGPRH